MTDKQSHATASIRISDVQEPYDLIRSYMTNTLPGTDPNNAEVLRFAVNHAATHLPLIQEKDDSETGPE